jgi:hypothetical protein
MSFKSAVIGLALAVGALAATQAVAAPEFLQYEGRDAVHDGRGGERKTIDGVDFWLRGDPPRRYQVLGSLEDKRHKTGLYGAIRMSGLDSDIAKAAKAAGGDAVILDAEQDEVTGVAGSSAGNINGSYGNGSFNANRYSFGTARTIKDHESRYVVIKYLPDGQASQATAAPSSTQAPP